jgi:predicted nucleic acid-binding protein
VVSFVLDCSVAVTWCFADEASASTDALLDQMQEQGAVVPQLWHLEIGNVLTQAERRGRITAGDMAARIELLRRLPIITDDETAGRALRDILALARAHRLTTYDASYLELAARRSLPLATRDKELREAVERMGMTLLPV